MDHVGERKSPSPDFGEDDGILLTLFLKKMVDSWELLMEKSKWINGKLSDKKACHLHLLYCLFLRYI